METPEAPKSAFGTAPKAPSSVDMGRGLSLLGKASGIGLSAGCLTALATLAALFVGLWLDQQFGTRPMFTLTFVLGSIPLSLIAMVWWVLRNARKVAEAETAAGAHEER
jgi:F0F1-type ATP synthase assembly protein I